MPTIISELSRIQKELVAPKSQQNDFGKYKYRSCEDILRALKPIQGDCAIVCDDEVEEIGGRFYIVATATIHYGEEVRSARGRAREADTKKGMDPAQITGSASSYARKYALSGLFAIDNEKDPDARAPAKKETMTEELQRHEPPKPPKGERGAVREEAGHIDKKYDRLLKYCTKEKAMKAWAFLFGDKEDGRWSYQTENDIAKLREEYRKADEMVERFRMTNKIIELQAEISRHDKEDVAPNAIFDEPDDPIFWKNSDVKKRLTDTEEWYGKVVKF